MKPDRKHDTTGQLSREGQKKRGTRERSKITDALEKEAKQIAEDLENRYRNSDTAGVQNSQGGGNLGGLGGPGNFGGGSLDKSRGR